MHRLAVLAALGLAVACAAPAQAFASIMPGSSPHDDITAVAGELGWSKAAVKQLQAAVRQPDIDDLRAAPTKEDKTRLDTSAVYQPWHHCDRVPPATDAGTVNATRAYIAQQRDLALNLSLLDPVAATNALGRALHALQDCFSHTDIVDRPAGEQEAFVRFLLGGGQAPAVRVCGVQPGAADIERPAGDPYPHADHNKDDTRSSPDAKATLPDGRSKHQAAKALATDATRSLLQDVLAQLDGDATARLLSVKAPAHINHLIPAAPLQVPAAALLGVALLRRRGRGPPEPAL